MAETDQTPPSSSDDDGAQAAAQGTGAEGAAAAPYSEVVWIFGEISPSDTAADAATGPQSLGDGDLLLAATVSVQVPAEVPANLDQALDQLTTGTDLFDIPVLDLHSS
jgi:hypothetical protein